jgi:hypothetical protein
MGELTGTAVASTIGTWTTALHRASAGHPGSPPPLAAAMFRTEPVAPEFRTTVRGKVTEAPGVSPAVTVQVTVTPAAVHPDGTDVSLTVLGSVSTTIAGAVVGCDLSFTTVKLKVRGVPAAMVDASAVLVRRS